VIAHPDITAHFFDDNGPFPNNRRLPLLVMKNAVALSGSDPAACFEILFKRHRWENGWRNGIFAYHHFHSTAHEVLGIYAGGAEVQFGGPEGPTLAVSAGDAVVIPAGVAHKRQSASSDFRVVGSYPRGQSPDMNIGRPEERPGVYRNIDRTSIPDQDPIFGIDGPLIMHWTS
jgi:uncharacterized protein YjlB